ncbi:hypothetical protein C0V70_17745 [Bacteriovorax stolpii]|uniref:Uncharacterized protein n=1 Tax=Bacteriovorax stolpii TaxID=960 RepID=A0A2K9NXZ5_BACTC|nr:hypothetical protein [Bacteriovorax stolpii]AUN99915.1 hypothetical protein C0V70_17745 [Bacteriovorax stolpii]
MVIMEHFDFGNSIFSLEKIWDQRTAVSQKTALYLSPDSNPYCSRLNPIFSFEVEDDYLRYFNVLSLRDGVYPLLRFFFINPAPHVADPMIIIDEKLSSLVPKAWREKTLLRSLYDNEKVFPKPIEECLILISPDKDSLPLEIMEVELAKLAEKTKKYPKISFYFSSCIRKGEEYAEAASTWGYTTLNAVNMAFGGRNIEILDWGKLQKKNLAKVCFTHFNPLSFYFTDSFLTHDLLQRGATLLENKKTMKNVIHREELSMNHGFELAEWFDDHKQSLYDKVDLKSLFGDEIREKPAFKGYTFITLTNHSFKQFALERAKELYQ